MNQRGSESGAGNLLLGVGNRLRRDDGAGPYVAERISSPLWVGLDCGPVPGNFTSKIKALSPQHLVLVDAAKMGQDPGTFRQLPLGQADRMIVSTHHIPLTALLSYVGDYAEEMMLIGIEPQILDHGEGLTQSVRAGCDELVEVLSREDWKSIPQFQ